MLMDVLLGPFSGHFPFGYFFTLKPPVGVQNVKSMKSDCDLHKDAKVTSGKRVCQHHINEKRKGSFPLISTVFLANLLSGQISRSMKYHFFPLDKDLKYSGAEHKATNPFYHWVWL